MPEVDTAVAVDEEAAVEMAVVTAEGSKEASKAEAEKGVDPVTVMVVELAVLKGGDPGETDSLVVLEAVRVGWALLAVGAGVMAEASKVALRVATSGAVQAAAVREAARLAVVAAPEAGQDEGSMAAKRAAAKRVAAVWREAAARAKEAQEAAEQEAGGAQTAEAERAVEATVGGVMVRAMSVAAATEMVALVEVEREVEVAKETEGEAAVSRVTAVT